MHDYKAADRVLAKDLRSLDEKRLYFGKYGDTYRKLAEKYFYVLGGGEASEEDVRLIDQDVKLFEQPVSTEKFVPAENSFVYTPKPVLYKPIENFEMANKKRKRNGKTVVKGRPLKRRKIQKRKAVVVVPRPGPAMKFPRGGLAAPVAFLPNLPGENKAAFNGRNKDNFRYVGTDRIWDFVPLSATTAGGDVIFNMRFTPQDFLGMPRLKVLSKLWARWKLKRLHMTLVTKAPSSASGGWVAYWDPESGDNPQDLAVADRVFVATAHKGATEGYWWGKRYDITAPHKPDYFYTDVTSHSLELDPKWIYSHRFVFIANASAGLVVGSTMATMYLHADIEFSNPTIEGVVSPSPADQTMDLFETGGGTFSSITQLGTVPQKTTGSMVDMAFIGGSYIEQRSTQICYNSTGASYFMCPPGRWFLYFEMLAGAGLTTSTWTVGSAIYGAVISQSHITIGTKLVTMAIVDFYDNRGQSLPNSVALKYGNVTATPTGSSLRFINCSNALTSPKSETHLVSVMKRVLKDMGIQPDEKVSVDNGFRHTRLRIPSSEPQEAYCIVQGDEEDEKTPSAPRKPFGKPVMFDAPRK